MVRQASSTRSIDLRLSRGAAAPMFMLVPPRHNRLTVAVVPHST